MNPLKLARLLTIRDFDINNVEQMRMVADVFGLSDRLNVVEDLVKFLVSKNITSPSALLNDEHAMAVIAHAAEAFTSSAATAKQRTAVICKHCGEINFLDE